MKKLPHLQFYPGDWLRDHVAGCSLAAQGLWLRMLLLMHDCERYGYLAVNGTPIPPAQIARKCGCDCTEQYVTLLEELDLSGVPSRTEEGVIFSRRMVRDAKKRADGNTRLKRFRNGNETPNDSNNENDIQILIEDVYAAYPLKVGKPDAFRAIAKAVSKHGGPLLLERTLAYAKARGGELSFVPNPATWFNQERYNDDPKTWVPKANGALVKRESGASLRPEQLAKLPVTRL